MSRTVMRQIGIAFFVGIVAGYLAFRLPLRPNAQRHIDPHDLVEKMRAHAQSSRLYYVEDWVGNIFLTEEARPIGELWSLAHDPRDAVRWKGVVHAWKLPPAVSANTSDWGESGRQIGDFCLFGDPVLVRRIGELLG